MNKHQFQTFHEEVSARVLAKIESNNPPLPIDLIAQDFFKYRLEIAEATIIELLLYYPSSPQEALNKAREICASKGHDYASEDNSFSNFFYCEKLQICSATQGILIRLCDKFSRLHNLIDLCKEPQVADESHVDTLLDTINYIIIWLALESSK